jgi:hypothetical protein
MVKQALERGGRTIDGHCELLTHDRHRHVDVFNAAQDVGHQVAAFEACGVAVEGCLVIGASVDIVEYRPGQTSFRQLSKIMEVVTMAHAHVVLRIGSIHGGSIHQTQ